MNLEFAYESRHTVKSFSLIVFVKTISTLNMEHGVKSEKGTELENYPSRLTLSRQPRMWTNAILQMTSDKVVLIKPVSYQRCVAVAFVVF